MERSKVDAMEKALMTIRDVCHPELEGLSRETLCISIRNLANEALAAPARPCDTMDWRDAWAKWRTEVKPQKPETYGEAYEGTEAFLDWFTTPMKGE